MSYRCKKFLAVKVRGVAKFPQLDKVDAVTKKFQTKLVLEGEDAARVYKMLSEYEFLGAQETSAPTDTLSDKKQFILQQDGTLELYVKSQFKPTVIDTAGKKNVVLTVFNASDITVAIAPMFVMSDHFIGLSLGMGAVEVHRNGALVVNETPEVPAEAGQIARQPWDK